MFYFFSKILVSGHEDGHLALLQSFEAAGDRGLQHPSSLGHHLDEEVFSDRLTKYVSETSAIRNLSITKFPTPLISKNLLDTYC